MGLRGVCIVFQHLRVARTNGLSSSTSFTAMRPEQVPTVLPAGVPSDEALGISFVPGANSSQRF